LLSKFSVKKPYTIVVAVVMVLVLGFISFTNLTTDLLPSMDLPYVVVSTTYPGASPEKIEESVTKPLEQSLSTTNGMKNITSVSNENYSMVILEFNQNINMDSAMIEMSGKIDQVAAGFEDGVGTPTLLKINPDMMPIMMLSVDVTGMDQYEISDYVSNTVVPELERIDGVASVTATGTVEKQLQIRLDQEKIDALNDQVLRSIDSTLADAQAELDQAKSDLAGQKDQFEQESKTQTESMAEASIQLQDGKKQLEDAISKIGMSRDELTAMRDEAVSALSELQTQLAQAKQLYEQMELAGQDTTQISQTIAALEDAIEQTQAGISSTDQGIQAFDALDELKEQEKELETGKLTLNQKLTEASVQISNGEQKLTEAQTQLDEQKEKAYEQAGLDGMITSDTISQILQAENFSMPAGYLTEGNDQYLVKVGDTFSGIEEIENLLLFQIDAGDIGNVYLKDVASVSVTDNADENYAKINGNNGILLTLEKSSTTSTTDVTAAIGDRLDEMMAENKDLHVISLMDQGVYINLVIDSVLQNLLYGGILAIIVLIFFLKSIKPTFIIACSIPISLMVAITLMYFSGIMLNIISLSGLALGVGMLVDNSIVVIENIYRLRNLGVSKAQAAVQGAKQVAGAITASTLTTICVFLPIVFTDGMTRELFTDMGLTIAYSLFASLVVAMTLVPTMASTILTRPNEKPHRWFDRFVDGYERLLRFCLRRKAFVLILTVVLLGVSAVATGFMGTEFIPQMDSAQMSATLTMPPETEQDDVYKASDTWMERALDVDGVETVGAMQGGMTSMTGGNSKTMSFYLLLDENTKRSNDEIKKELLQKTGDLGGEVEVTTSMVDMSMLGGSGIELVIKGNDLDQLVAISEDLKELLQSVEGTTDISNGLEGNSTETRVIVDKNKAMEYGLTVAQVYQEVAKAIQTETTSTTLSMETEEYPVILVNDAEVTRATLESYLLTGTKDQQETTVRLGDIASIEEAESLTAIQHDNQTRTMSVTAAIDEDHNVGLVSRDVQKALEQYDVPDGYTVTISGESETINSALRDLVLMILLAILFIYLIMVAQFQSLLSPFIVLFTLPLAFTGGLLALLITGKELSVISMLGFLVLAGVVVNNAIVFVDYANQLRLGGMEKREALIETGRTRIRPILMTALTTILAMLTMAFGIGDGAEMTQPLAIVMIGGLGYATFLTLLVIPCMYDIFHRKEMKPVLLEEDSQEKTDSDDAVPSSD
jgi:multidrug efflux pump subunit AcrB